MLVSGVLNAQITASNTTGTQSATKSSFDEVSIYPNPTKRGFINISGFSPIESSEAVLIQIFNLNGKLIKTHNIVMSNGVSSISIEDLLEGEYTVRILTNSQCYTSRLLVVD